MALRKEKVATITVEVAVEGGGPFTTAVEWIDFLDKAIREHKYNYGGSIGNGRYDVTKVEVYPNGI